MIKRFYQEKFHFLPLFWFVIKNVDLFFPANLGSRESGPFLFTWTNIVFYVPLYISLKINPKDAEKMPVLREMQTKYHILYMKNLCKNFQRTHLKWGPELYKIFVNCQLFWIISTIFGNERIEKKFFFNFYMNTYHCSKSEVIRT